jgi:hypothetical protein
MQEKKNYQDHISTLIESNASKERRRYYFGIHKVLKSIMMVMLAKWILEK